MNPTYRFTVALCVALAMAACAPGGAPTPGGNATPATATPGTAQDGQAAQATTAGKAQPQGDTPVEVRHATPPKGWKIAGQSPKARIIERDGQPVSELAPVQLVPAPGSKLASNP